MKTGSSVNPVVNDTFLESGKDKAGKGEGWALPFIFIESGPVTPTAFIGNIFMFYLTKNNCPVASCQSKHVLTHYGKTLDKKCRFVARLDESYCTTPSVGIGVGGGVGVSKMLKFLR